MAVTLSPKAIKVDAKTGSFVTEDNSSPDARWVSIVLDALKEYQPFVCV